VIIFDTIKWDASIPKKKKRFDMEVGGVSGPGAAGAVGGVGSSHSVGGDAPDIPTNTSGVDQQSVNKNTNMSMNIDLSVNMDMSTQDYTSLKGMSESSECSNHSHDMKKLIELILAIKLLEEVNKTQEDKGGFSAIA